MDSVLGQASFTSDRLFEPVADYTLNEPTRVVVDRNTGRVVADTNNLRVLSWSSATVFPGRPRAPIWLLGSQTSAPISQGQVRPPAR